MLVKITKLLKLLNLQPNQESRSLIYDKIYKLFIKLELPPCIDISYEYSSSYTNDVLLVLSYNNIIYIYIYIVNLLVQIINCTNCTVCT